jgi:hypothetical protein
MLGGAGRGTTLVTSRQARPVMHGARPGTGRGQKALSTQAHPRCTDGAARERNGRRGREGVAATPSTTGNRAGEGATALHGSS